MRMTQAASPQVSPRHSEGGDGRALWLQSLSSYYYSCVKHGEGDWTGVRLWLAEGGEGRLGWIPAGFGLFFS